MAQIRFTNGFEDMSDSKLEEKASFIIVQMTGNANFPNPDPLLSEVQNALNTFSNAVVAAANGDRMKIALRKQAKKDLVNTLHLLSAYVAYASKGDLLVAQTSGFSLFKTPSPTPIIQPQNLQVQNTDQSGTVKVSVNKVRGAVSYMHQYTTDATLKEESWQSMNCTQSKCTITGLTPATVYYFRVVAIGRKDQVMTGYVASKVVA